MPCPASSSSQACDLSSSFPRTFASQAARAPTSTQGQELPYRCTQCMQRRVIVTICFSQRMPKISAFRCTTSLVNKSGKQPCLAPYLGYPSEETYCTESCDGSWPSGNRYLEVAHHSLCTRFADVVLLAQLPFTGVTVKCDWAHWRC